MFITPMLLSLIYDIYCFDKLKISFIMHYGQPQALIFCKFHAKLQYYTKKNETATDFFYIFVR